MRKTAWIALFLGLSSAWAGASMVENPCAMLSLGISPLDPDLGIVGTAWGTYRTRDGERWAAEHGRHHPTAGPVLFTCRHLTHGVGMYPVIDAFPALDALDTLVAQHGRGDLVIGSISACHGALAVLRVEAA